jgi:PBP1b-binding outer membrane lipoprotein LpoB
MMKQMKILTVVVLSGLALFLSACSSTKVTSSWKEPETSLSPDQKIMVLGLVQDRQGALQARKQKWLPH